MDKIQTSLDPLNRKQKRNLKDEIDLKHNFQNNSQHYSARFTAMFQNKLHVYVARQFLNIIG